MNFTINFELIEKMSRKPFFRPPRHFLIITYYLLFSLFIVVSYAFIHFFFKITGFIKPGLL